MTLNASISDSVIHFNCILQYDACPWSMLKRCTAESRARDAQRHWTRNIASMDENNAMRRDKLERAHFSKKKKKKSASFIITDSFWFVASLVCSLYVM